MEERIEELQQKEERYKEREEENNADWKRRHDTATKALEEAESLLAAERKAWREKGELGWCYVLILLGKEQAKAFSLVVAKAEAVQHEYEESLIKVKIELVEAQRQNTIHESRQQSAAMKITSLETMLATKNKQMSELRQKAITYVNATNLWQKGDSPDIRRLEKKLQDVTNGQCFLFVMNSDGIVESEKVQQNLLSQLEEATKKNAEFFETSKKLLDVGRAQLEEEKKEFEILRLTVTARKYPICWDWSVPEKEELNKKRTELEEQENSVHDSKKSIAVHFVRPFLYDQLIDLGWIRRTHEEGREKGEGVTGD